MATIDPTFITLAQDYLATKERTPHYEIRSISDCCPADGWCDLQSFSDEDMTKLLALREKYGKDEFFNHLDEIFDEDTLRDMIYGSEVISFDLDNENYMYSFTLYEIASRANGSFGVERRPVKVNLSNEIYVMLLALCLNDEYLNINSLRYADRELYNIVTYLVDSTKCCEGGYCAVEPYTVTFDEIIEDANNIRKQNPELFDTVHYVRSYSFI
jgi:hypothetical protein